MIVQADLLWLFFREALVHAIESVLRERARRDFLIGAAHCLFRIVIK
jgi:hypothetical protein